MPKDNIDWKIDKWLRLRQVSIDKYNSLSVGDRNSLNDSICFPEKCVTALQRKNLYKKLFAQGISGRKAIDPTDYVPDEKLKTLFSLPNTECLTDLEKY
jgi:hypothetical protein